MRKRRVLVVDDDNLLAKILQKILEQNGFAVESASEGRTALRMIPKFRPDLVILDVMMPVDNGCRVSRIIKTLVQVTGVHVPKVLLLTARRLDHDPAGERAFLEQSLADGMMYKPYDHAVLLARINDLLANQSRPLSMAGGLQE